MRPIMKPLLSLGCATALLVSATVSAYAACTEFSFAVNDYGKDEPTRHAKLLLDKWIADWAQRVSLKKYKVGTKSVSCKLFLDFVVFDEFTCKATAKVCWSGIGYEVLKARASKNPQKNTITLTKAELKGKGKGEKVAKKSSKAKRIARQRRASAAAALKRKQAQKAAKKAAAAKIATAKPVSKPPVQTVKPQRALPEPTVQVVKVKSPEALKRKGADIATGSVTPTPREPPRSPPVSSARAAAIANARAAAEAATAAAHAASAAARAAEAAAKLVEATR
jgi:hypothetical protein